MYTYSYNVYRKQNNAAVQKSWRSLVPAQVATAPTQRKNFRTTQNKYTLFSAEMQAKRAYLANPDFPPVEIVRQRVGTPTRCFCFQIQFQGRILYEFQAFSWWIWHDHDRRAGDCYRLPIPPAEAFEAAHRVHS